ncbi:hypothetical protein D623_10014712 [Myotis brandtii]|uniref:Uncharacterized protein n=1 Tax=Myotis brandtii TaxID=109478 RepID=S7P391_MYOBR|nr:hypothetical protein D623_10014712 [Myotis brandtii]
MSRLPLFRFLDRRRSDSKAVPASGTHRHTTSAAAGPHESGCWDGAESSEGLAVSGFSEGLAVSGFSEGLAVSGSSEGLAVSGSSEGLAGRRSRAPFVAFLRVQFYVEDGRLISVRMALVVEPPSWRSGLAPGAVTAGRIRVHFREPAREGLSRNEAAPRWDKGAVGETSTDKKEERPTIVLGLTLKGMQVYEEVNHTLQLLHDLKKAVPSLALCSGRGDHPTLGGCPAGPRQLWLPKG